MSLNTDAEGEEGTPERAQEEKRLKGGRKRRCKVQGTSEALTSGPDGQREAVRGPERRQTVSRQRPTGGDRLRDSEHSGEKEPSP